MKKRFELELKVGVFVTIGLVLIGATVIILGGSDSILTRSKTYYSAFKSVDGLIPGAKVILSGVPVGTVKAVDLNHEDKNIRVSYSVQTQAVEWIREDSTVEIATQGVLGDKYINIQAGSPEQPVLKPGSSIAVRPSKDISKFISHGDQLLRSLNTIAGSLERVLRSFEHENRSEIFFRNMTVTSQHLSQLSDKMNREFDQIRIKSSVHNLNQILEKINNGTGTLGALINDPSLYDEIRALAGGANRNRIVRNLVRQTIKNSTPDAPAATKK